MSAGAANRRLAAHAVVIGAGLAGLAAADELLRGGAQVTVVEARDRVGGRVWSRRLPNGATIEMGAEFILPGSTVVRDLADRFGLGLWDKGMRYGRREPRGVAVEAQALEAAVAEVDRALAGLSQDDRSARELVEGLAIDPAAREAILARVEISAASPAASVPARDLAGLAHIDDAPAPSIAGGNQRLAEALAREAGDGLMLSSVVRRVAWGEEGVRLGVEGAGGLDEIGADVAVVAVPAGVIDAIRFEPPLPDASREALAEVRYGHAAKLFVPLRSPAHPGAVMSVPERYWSWTATGEADRPMPVVSAFAGSPAALERLRVAAGPGDWLAALARLRPELELDVEGAVLSTWDDDPWVGAAYSVSASTAAVSAMPAPVGPLAFAGEHCGGDFSGLMEGALRSGRSAARQLLPAPA